ncbi:MAG TPA: aldo/keto reductase [Steroidobacteraceae bacterium]|jgi:aryl-alcohol dehydrogenase-like predicted oxidoreductase|nr:aldo/keto reductase [Steroidobacteraceae bacterium]
MQMRKLGTTNLDIAPLVLGGNVFGWTADKETSFSLLDAFLEAGFNAIDTADVYSRFVPGHKGGESEIILGEWMKSRGNRDRVVLITKGGMAMGEGMEGLGRNYLRQACEASLRRLQTDYIDVYLSHRADPKVPIEETLELFQELIDGGKVRHTGCSNYSAEQLSAALAASGAGRASYQVLQPEYNLLERKGFEGALDGICQAQGVGVITYFSLAAGFLTGKYRTREDLAGSARGRMTSKYLTSRGLELLAAIDKVARNHEATPAQVSLAWLMSRRSVTAPIASATRLTQLREIMKSVELELTPEDLRELEE